MASEHISNIIFGELVGKYKKTSLEDAKCRHFCPLQTYVLEGLLSIRYQATGAIIVSA